MERTFNKTAVIGAGAWGTALAFTASQNGGEVVLWTYKEEEAAAIRAKASDDVARERKNAVNEIKNGEFSPEQISDLMCEYVKEYSTKEKNDDISMCVLSVKEV